VATARRADPGEDRLRAILRAMGGARSTENNIALLTILGQIGDDAALPTLKSAATRRDAELREAAIRVLGRWGSPAPLDILDRILRKPKNEVDQRLALNGYLRLLRLPNDRDLAETITYFESIATRPLSTSQKKQLLAGLSELEDPAALPLITLFLDDPDVAEESALALEKVGGE